jgi:hypothetical protein
MPATEDGANPLDQVMALIPAGIKESWDQFRARERARHASFDAKRLADLRDMAVEALRGAAATFSTTTLTTTLRAHGWTRAEAGRLATYFGELAGSLNEVGLWGSISMFKWFDDIGISTGAEDELTEVAYDAATVYNAYVKRKWSKQRGTQAGAE